MITQGSDKNDALCLCAEEPEGSRGVCDVDRELHGVGCTSWDSLETRVQTAIAHTRAGECGLSDRVVTPDTNKRKPSSV